MMPEEEETPSLDSRHLYRFGSVGVYPYARPYHLLKDPDSGHLIKGLLARPYTTYNRAYYKYARYDTDLQKQKATFNRSHGMNELRRTFDAAEWKRSNSEDGSGILSVWGNSNGSGAYYGYWYTYVAFNMYYTRYTREEYLTYVKRIHINIDYYNVWPGAGEARLGILSTDSTTPPISTLAEIQSLPYVTVNGTGVITTPELHFPAAKYVCLVGYFQDLLPPTGDGSVYDWDRWDYPMANFTMEKCIVELETEDQANPSPSQTTQEEEP